MLTYCCLGYRLRRIFNSTTLVRAIARKLEPLCLLTFCSEWWLAHLVRCCICNTSLLVNASSKPHVQILYEKLILSKLTSKRKLKCSTEQVEVEKRTKDGPPFLLFSCELWYLSHGT